MIAKMDLGMSIKEICARVRLAGVPIEKEEALIFVDEAIRHGWIETCGVSEDGERLYRFTLDGIKHVNELEEG